MGSEGEAVCQVEGEVLHPHQGLPTLLQERVDTADRVRTIPIQGLCGNIFVIIAGHSLSPACRTIPPYLRSRCWLLPNPNRPTGRQRPFGLVSAVVTNKGRAVIGIRVQREPAVNGRLGLLVNPHSLGATEGICFTFLMAAVHLRSRGTPLALFTYFTLFSKTLVPVRKTHASLGLNWR